MAPLNSRNHLLLLLSLLASTSKVSTKISLPPKESVEVPLHQFSTKTAYRNLLLRPASQPPTGCQSKQLIAVLRHGSRGPSLKQIRKAEVALHRLGNSFKADAQFTKVAKSWSNPFSLHAGDKSLSPIGHEEHELIGRRFAASHPHLFANPDAVSVISSSADRSFESAKSFLHGAGLQELAPQIDDSLTRFFDSCKRFKVTVDDSKEARAEFEQFKSGSEMQRAVELTKQRLQLLDIDLLPADLALAYVLCGMELANNLTAPQDSPWCRLIDDDEVFDTLEYLFDLKHFWRKSYGYELNHLISCGLLSDIRQQLEAAAAATAAAPTQSQQYNSARLYFGHAETIFPLLARLGLFKDPVKLMHSNFALMRHQREFRASRLVPFSGNLAMILMDCSGQLRVQLLLNEVPILWPMCNDFTCSLDSVLDHLAKRCSVDFDFDATCSHDGQSQHDDSPRDEL